MPSDLVITMRHLSDRDLERIFGVSVNLTDTSGEVLFRDFEAFQFKGNSGDIVRYYLTVPYFKQEDNLQQLAFFLRKKLKEANISPLDTVQGTPIFRCIAFSSTEIRALKKAGFGYVKKGDYFGFGVNDEQGEKIVSDPMSVACGIITNVTNILKENSIMSPKSLAELRKCAENLMSIHSAIVSVLEAEIKEEKESVTVDVVASPVQKEKASAAPLKSRNSQLRPVPEKGEVLELKARQRSARVLYVAEVDSPADLGATLHRSGNTKDGRKEFVSGIKVFFEYLDKDVRANNLTSKRLYAFMEEVMTECEAIKASRPQAYEAISGLVQKYMKIADKLVKLEANL